MIKAKLIALCVCPAVTAPPAIMAVSPPARHAVAYVLHRAARRLDHTPRAAAQPPLVAALAAPAPCPPVIAASAAAGQQVGANLPTDPGFPDPTAALADLSSDRPIDRAPAVLALTARPRAASGRDQKTDVQIAALDASPAATATATATTRAVLR